MNSAEDLSISLDCLDIHDELGEEAIAALKRVSVYLARHLTFHEAIAEYTEYTDARLTPFEQKLAGYIIHHTFLSGTHDLTCTPNTADELILDEVYLFVMQVLGSCMLRFPLDHSPYLINYAYPVNLLATIARTSSYWVIMIVESTKYLIRLFHGNTQALPILLQDQLDPHKLFVWDLTKVEEDALLRYLETPHRRYLTFVLNMLENVRDCQRLAQDREAQIVAFCTAPWFSLVFFAGRRIVEDM